jgi:hypothetical protein
MIRPKLRLLGLSAIVFGVMAMSAGSAQAKLFQWITLATPGGPATELKVDIASDPDSKDRSLVAHLLGKLFWITCTSMSLKGVSLEVLGTLTEGGKAVFAGCEAYGKGPLTEALGCHVHSTGKAAGTVETSELKGATLLHEVKAGETEPVVKIEPKTGETLATFLTEECVMPESNPVRGKLFLRDCEKKAPVHLVRHLFASHESLTKLWIGAHSAEHLSTFVEGSDWIKLTGSHFGMEWGIKHVKP